MKVTVDQIKTALASSGGLVGGASRNLNVSRQAVHKRIQSSSELKQFVEDIREDMLDLAENRLLQLIRDGDRKAIEFYLNAKGISRGYGPRPTTNEVERMRGINQEMSAFDLKLAALFS